LSKTNLQTKFEGSRPAFWSRESVSLPQFKVQSKWGSVELVDAIAEEWRQLCWDGPCNEPFYRPEWIAAAVRAFASQQRLLLLTVRNGDRLCAVLPLLEKKGWTRGLPSTRLYSANIMPRFEFVHGAESDLNSVVSAAWEHLRRLSGWDSIELVNVPQGGAAERLVSAAKADSFPACRYEYAKSPYILLQEHKPEGDFSRFGRSSRFRYHLRQGWREMNKKGPLRLRRVEHADRGLLQRFYRLEQSGWKGRKGTAISCQQETIQFFDEVAQKAEQFGYLSMYFLELGDAIVAAHLAFTYGGGYYPVKVAYDERFAEYGPGHLIIGQVLEDCVQRGLSRFDCLGDWTDAKSKWASDVLPHAFCGIFRKSVAGHIRCAEARWLHELNQTAHRLLGPAVHAARAYAAKRRRRSTRPPREARKMEKQ
jgi:CelD/BcsL family acetyltransferase involved in cellulose biosynthesis